MYYNRKSFLFPSTSTSYTNPKKKVAKTFGTFKKLLYLCSVKFRQEKKCLTSKKLKRWKKQSKALK